MKNRFLFFAAIAAGAQLIGSNADARPARCVVVSNGMKPFKGVCDFAPDGTGGFGLSRARGHKFLEIDPIHVAVVSPGVAEVRGLTRAGVNSRWGEARRSKSDPACWVGDDFKICAY